MKRLLWLVVLLVLLVSTFSSSLAAQTTTATIYPLAFTAKVQKQQGNSSSAYTTLWLGRSDGTEMKEVVDDQSPVYSAEWSPDGSRILFVGSRLAAYDVNSGALTDIISAADLLKYQYTVNYVSWTPDGSAVLFDAMLDRNVDVWLVNADGSNARALTKDNLGVDDYPSISPDGQYIAYFLDDKSLWVMKADGTEATNLTPDPDMNPWRAMKDRRAVWSPDSTKLVYVGEDRRSGPKLVIVDLATRSVQDLVPAESVGDSLEGAPAWSPDSSKIAFVGEVLDEIGDPQYMIFTVAPDGSNLTPITQAIPGRHDYPSWSADGQQLAFTVDASGDRRDVYVINADGSAPSNITLNAIPESGADSLFLAEAPVWAPLMIEGASGGDVVANPDATSTAAPITAANVADLTMIGAIQFGQATTWDFSPDQRTLAAVDLYLEMGKEIRLCDPLTAQSADACRELVDPEFQPLKLRYSSEQSVLAIAYETGEVQLWNPQSGTPLINIQVYEYGLLGDFALRPDGKRLVTISNDVTSDKSVRLWDTSSGEVIAEIESGARFNGPIQLAYSPDGSKIAYIQDGKAAVWDIQSGTAPIVFPSDLNGTIALAFSPDSKFVAALETGGLSLLSIETGNLAAKLPYTNNNLTLTSAARLAFSPDGNLLAVATSGSVQIIDLAASSNVAQFESNAPANVTFSSDGAILVFEGADNAIQFWAASGTTLPSSPITPPAVSISDSGGGDAVSVPATPVPSDDTSTVSEAGAVPPLIANDEFTDGLEFGVALNYYHATAWALYGNAGDVFVAVASCQVGTAPIPALTIYAADDTLVASNDNVNMFALGLVVPETGIYQLYFDPVVGIADPPEAAFCALNVQLHSSGRTETQPIVPPQYLPSEAGSYTFQSMLLAGQTVYWDFQGTWGMRVTIQIESELSLSASIENAYSNAYVSGDNSAGGALQLKYGIQADDRYRLKITSSSGAIGKYTITYTLEST